MPSSNNNNQSSSTFDDMQIENLFNHSLLRGVYAFGFEHPTLTQQRTIMAFSPASSSSSTINNNDNSNTTQQQQSSSSSSENHDSTSRAPPASVPSNILVQGVPGSGRSSGAIIGAMSRTVVDGSSSCNNAAGNDQIENNRNTGVQTIIITPSARQALSANCFARDVSDYIEVSNGNGGKKNRLSDNCVCLNTIEDDLDEDNNNKDDGGAASSSSSLKKKTTNKKPSSSTSSMMLEKSEERKIKEAIVISSTPEKLLEHVKSGRISLSNVNTVILDDADENSRSAREDTLEIIAAIGGTKKNNKKSDQKSGKSLAATGNEKQHTNMPLQICAITSSSPSSAENNNTTGNVFSNNAQPAKLPGDTAQFIDKAFSLVNKENGSSNRNQKGKNAVNIDTTTRKIFAPSIAVASSSAINDYPTKYHQEALRFLQGNSTFPGTFHYCMQYPSSSSKETNEENNILHDDNDDDDDEYEREEKVHQQKLQLLKKLFQHHILSESRAVVFVNSEQSIAEVTSCLANTTTTTTSSSSSSANTTSSISVIPLFDKMSSSSSSSAKNHLPHAHAARLFASSLGLSYLRYYSSSSIKNRYFSEPPRVLVTTPEIYKQSYEAVFKRFHWTRILVNFDLPSSEEGDDGDASISSEYLFDRSMLTIRSSVECGMPLSVKVKVSSGSNLNSTKEDHKTTATSSSAAISNCAIINLLGSEDLTKGKDTKSLNKICKFFGLERNNKMSNDMAPTLHQMIDIAF